MSIAWPMVPLGQVLSERAESPSDEALAVGDVPIVAKIGFNDGKILLRQDGNTKTGMILIRPGDLVVSGINAAKGAIAVYGRENAEPIAATIHYGSYVPNEQKVDVKYLWWLLRSQVFRELLLLHVPGGIKTELKAKRLLPIPVPMPDVAEQRRIVARIEELAAKIAEGRSLRVSAVSCAQSLSDSETSRLFAELSGEADVCKLGDVIRNAGYGTSVKCDYERHEDAYPVLRIPNVASETISFEDMKYGRLEEAAIKRLALYDGDLLLVRTNGSADLVGRCAVVRHLREPTAFASYLICLRCDKSRTDPDYLQRMLRHLRRGGQLFDFARTTAGQYNISLGRLRAAMFPLPPLEEQHRIITYVDDLQAKVDGLKQLQAQTVAELDALLPSILDKAFKGEL